MSDLYWFCTVCGDYEAVEPTEPPYTPGDKEKCITCGLGWAVVVAHEQLPSIQKAAAEHLRLQALRAAVDAGAASPVVDFSMARVLERISKEGS